MKRIIYLIGFSMLFAAWNLTAGKPAYRIFTSKGNEVSYGKMVHQIGSSDAVFFGELHDNPICHWMEFEIMKDLSGGEKKLVIGAEMFETDNQLLLNEYIGGFIRKKDFEAEARLWPNYKTDYAPLVDFAREKKIPFIATNIPRRYAAIVNSKSFPGLDSINAYQRALIAPLPVKYDSALNCYRAMKSMTGGSGAMHQSMHLAEAQAIKDATMAWFISKNMDEGILFLHFNGAYHSENREGIVWYLMDYARRFPVQIEIATITCVEQEDVETLADEHLGKADYIICIPSSMTKTY
jgi:uncharacterized iron-regulated protein